MPAKLSLPEGVYKNKEKRWCRPCPSCNVEVSHLRRNYCIGAHTQLQTCIRCSNISNHPSGMVGCVRVSWYNSFEKSALTRGYGWCLTPEFVDTLHQQQRGLCIYSGLKIGWSLSGWDHTASIDRINNDLGYTEENVQLVHKEINMLRGSLESEKFVELCKLVADKAKW